MTDTELLHFMEDTASEINILDNTGQFSSGYYEREFILNQTLYRFACDENDKAWVQFLGKEGYYDR